MFSAKLRHIDYRIQKPCGHVVHVPTTLNEYGIAVQMSENLNGNSVPDCYQSNDCKSCESHHGRCMAEDAIAHVASAFDDLKSTDSISTEVIMEGRAITLTAPAPRALASLLGLLMASSGCPRLAPFRAMALFHQPFATAEENVVRAAGFWLIRCWSKGNLPEANPFASLQAVWESLEDVNRHVGEKLLARTQSDVASNGIAYLDVLAKMGNLGIDSALDMLKPVLDSTASYSIQ